MSTKRNPHVVPHVEGWAVKREQATRATSVHSTQAEAIAAARHLAQRDKAELFIHGENGRIRDRRSYGQDPFPPKG